MIGFSSAVAAYGAFFIPRAFGISMKATGSPGRRPSWGSSPST